MKFSVFHNLGAPGRIDEYATVMGEAREFALAAEEAGFWSIWYTEHHFGHEGIEITPNPVIMSTDIAARTSRIRIGQAANIITFWHPLRLAEDLALLDQLSGGRLEIGIGRGLYGREALNLNPIADPRNEHQNRELFAETLEVMQKAWSEEFFSHHGRFYEFPQPGVRWNHPLSPPDERFADERGMITKMSVTPRPLQRPHPPLWQVIDTAAVDRVGRRARHQGHVLAAAGVGAEAPLRALPRARRRGRASRSRRARTWRWCATSTWRRPWSRRAATSRTAVMTSYRWILHWRGLRNLLEEGEELGAHELVLRLPARPQPAGRHAGVRAREDRRAARRAGPRAPADLDDAPGPAALPRRCAASSCSPPT